MANAKAAAKPEAEPEEGAEAPKGGKMKLIILAAVGLLVLGGGGGAAAYFMGFFGSKDAAAVPAPAGDAAHGDGHGDAHAKADEHKQEAAAAKPAAGDDHGAAPPATSGSPVAFVELPDILVNLRSSSKRMRFLKLKVALEVKDEKMAEQVKVYTPRILDGFQVYLRALEVEEIEGSRGMQSLKEELMARINHAVTPSRITDVLFKEILVQ